MKFTYKNLMQKIQVEYSLESREKATESGVYYNGERKTFEALYVEKENVKLVALCDEVTMDDRLMGEMCGQLEAFYKRNSMPFKVEQWDKLNEQ